MSLIKKQMSSKPSKNMSKIPTLKLTTCTPLKFKMYSKYIARASQKDSNHSNNCQTESYSGTVLELLTTLVFYHKVFVLHLQKPLLRVICLVKVFTSPIWFQNQRITVTLLGPTTLDYCYFAM